MRTLTSQQLTQAALDSRDFSEVVEAAARFLGNPLVIIAAATGSIVGHSRGLTPPDDTWLAAVDRGYITLEFVATLANWDHYKDRDPSRRYECITVTAINGRPRRFYKLTVRGQLLGYLNITRLDESFDTLPEEDCHFAAQLLATELYLQYKAMDTGAAAGTADASFLLDLIRGTFRSRAHFVDRIALSSFRTDRAYRVLSVELEEFFSYNAGEDTFKRELLAVFRRPVLAIDEHLLYLVVEEGEVTGSAAAGPMAELDRVLKKWKLICGISDPIVDLYEFDRYRRQALEAAGLRRYLLDPPANYTFFDAVKSYSLLCRIPREELLHYCSQKVYSIFQYDQAEHTDYIATLSAYLVANRSVKATAASLHVHRNTVNYRLARIRELFDLDLEDLRYAHQVLLSCQMIRLLQS